MRRAFSTSTTLRWQYKYAEALRIAGPLLKKSDKRTKVNRKKGSATAAMPLPLALQIISPTLDEHLHAFLQRATLNKLNEMVTTIEDEDDQMEITNEAGLIDTAGPYFYQVVKYLMPDILVALGYTGKIGFSTEKAASTDSTPDKIVHYNDKAILVLDYKGPNCVSIKELETCSASTVNSAVRKLADIRDRDRGKKTAEDSLLALPDVTLNTVTLFQQAVKYSRDTLASTVLFYDYDTLLVVEIPPELFDRAPNILLNTAVWTEKKSTEDERVYMKDNHVMVLINYILWTIVKEEGRVRPQ